MKYLEKVRLQFQMKTEADELLRTAHNLAITIDEMVRAGTIAEDSDIHDQANWYIEVACKLVCMLDKYASDDELIEIERRALNKISGYRTPYHKKIKSGKRAALDNAVAELLECF